MLHVAALEIPLVCFKAAGYVLFFLFDTNTREKGSVITDLITSPSVCPNCMLEIVLGPFALSSVLFIWCGGFNNKSESGGENFLPFYIFCLSGAREHGWREKESSLSLVKWEENRCIALTQWIGLPLGMEDCGGMDATQRDPIVFPVAEPGRSVCLRACVCARVFTRL